MLQYSEYVQQGRLAGKKGVPIKPLLQWIKDRFNNPAIVVTENGFSDMAGNLDDLQRV